jgi:hypothetical protein
MVKTEEIQIAFDIYQPFGPSILKTKLPQLYVDGLNAQADNVLADEKVSKDRDWSHNLAGNVKKEISIDHGAIEGLPEFLATISQEYTKRVLPDFLPEGTKIAFRVWAVSQWAGDFNPIHIHDSNLSGVCFLKIPPKFEEEYEKEDHHPTAGCLEFIGSVPNHFARHSFLAKPEVGDFYIFPSWLTHQVYPFRSEGERRSMAFNVHFTSDKIIKGIDG